MTPATYAVKEAGGPPLKCGLTEQEAIEVYREAVEHDVPAVFIVEEDPSAPVDSGIGSLVTIHRSLRGDCLAPPGGELRW
jgi:hypothetical protein